jgi:predicted RNase H-like HicB family nuclease
MMHFETEREDDGRWIAEAAELPGVLAYGSTRKDAIERAQEIAFQVIADRLEHGEDVPVVSGDA